MRLDKFLSEMNCGTRKEIKEWCKKGLVKVDGLEIKKSDTHISGNENIEVDGKLIGNDLLVYYLLNKPAGYVSATEDNLHPTVIDLIKEDHPKGIFPVGRLDIDTHGLLLISNDGGLAHKLLSPRKHVQKTYMAIVEGIMTKEHVERFKNGIQLEEDFVTQAAKLDLLEENVNPESYGIEADPNLIYSKVNITLEEGKFHQVKRMVQACACKVVYLKRIAFGKLRLDNSLKEGEYIKLSLEDII